MCIKVIQFTQNTILRYLLFNLCISHGYFFPAMIETTIVSNVKNKCGTIIDSNNYRPINLATIVSKLSLYGNVNII